MWITVGNLNAVVSRATEAEVAWLRSKESGLTYGNKKTFFATGQVEQVRFFDLLDSTFPAGFLPYVLQRAQTSGMQIQVIDSRTAPAQPLTAVMPGLRDYQETAVRAAIEKTRGIIQIATGGGKTNCAVAVAEHFPQCRWLLLVHRASLVEQAAERYEALTKKTAGRIGEGRWNEEQHFTCATFQSLAAALKNGKGGSLFKGVHGLIVDEAHTLPAASYYRVAKAFPNAYWRLGISATPLDREDQRSVFAVASLGPVIFKHAADALIQSGHLARPIIRMVSVEQEFTEVDRDGFIRRWPWRKVYEEGIIRSKTRNRALLAAVAKAERPCLVFVKEVAHGQAFTKALQKRGTKSEFVWGTASLQQRQAAVKRLVRGDLDAVVCSVIFQEGLDIPELRSVVIASGGKSVIAALQRIGRGMRLSSDKSTFEVWDVADTGNALLERHAKARRGAYQREKYPVSVVKLPTT